MPAKVSTMQRQEIADRIEESLMKDALFGGKVLESLNTLGKLRVVYHDDSLNTLVMRYLEITYWGNAGVLELHLARLSDVMPDMFRKDQQRIQYQELPQKFTVIGPHRHQKDGQMVAIRLTAEDWHEAVAIWRAIHAPERFHEDPTVLEGHVTPMNAVLYEESEEV